MSGWVTDAKRAARLGDVAAALGMTGGGRTLGPCPACDAERRSASERRLALNVLPNDRWKCWACGVGGSVIDLVGNRLGVDPTGSESCAWFASYGWCAPPRGAAVEIPKPRERPPPIELGDDREILTSEEVAEVWSRCHHGPAGWLRSRGLDPERVAEVDGCRALNGGPLPAWASHWPRNDCRAVLPLFDSSGRLSGLQGRRTRGEGTKSMAAAGVHRIGVLACPTGRGMLAGVDVPEAVVIAEGEPDWLTWASAVSPKFAVLGIPGSGAWTQAIADRIPTESVVLIRTHLDKAGGDYARLILSTLNDRCAVLDRQRSEAA